jgi:ribonuclease R
MKELKDILRKKRTRRGGIDFDFPEAKIKLDDSGKPIDIVKYELKESNHIIEEFMLVCNETVAEEMFFKEMPFVYRVHEEPDEDKLKDFAAFAYDFGYFIKRPQGKVHPKEFQKLLDKIKGRPYERIISTVMLRSLMKARYSAENLGHFGLAARYYCHFTSPIRRYPDLVIHRIIADSIKGEEMDYEELLGFCVSAAENSSEREISAMEAERDTDDLKKAEYMAERLGEVYTGIISSVTSFGMFVELENTVEGLVRMSNLDDDYYIYDEKKRQLIGEHLHRTYKIGDEVNIMVARADSESRQIDFVLDKGENERVFHFNKGTNYKSKKSYSRNKSDKNKDAKRYLKKKKRKR